MRWQYIFGALIGAFLGFTGQWLIFCHARSPFPPIVLIIGNKQVDNYLQSNRHIDKQNLPKARELWCEAKFLQFLELNGEDASHSIMLTALLGALTVFAADKLRRRTQHPEVASKLGYDSTIVSLTSLKLLNEKRVSSKPTTTATSGISKTSDCTDTTDSNDVKITLDVKTGRVLKETVD